MAIYVEKFTEAVQTEEAEANAAKEARIREIEAREAEAFPEPEVEEKILSAGDDTFTKQMKAAGLVHIDSAGREKRLNSDDLPPPLDLGAFLPAVSAMDEKEGTKETKETGAEM